MWLHCILVYLGTAVHSGLLLLLSVEKLVWNWLEISQHDVTPSRLGQLRIRKIHQTRKWTQKYNEPPMEFQQFKSFGWSCSSEGFKTKDSHIVVAAGNDKQFAKVCQVLDLMELTEEPGYHTNKLRVQHRTQLLHTLSQRFLEEKTADWLRKFEGSGVPVGPINSIQEVFSDPQVKHNGLIQEMNHPTAGRISVPGPAVRFSHFDASGPTPPPLIGQHTVQVLRDTLSYSEDVIKMLLESGAVSQNEVS